LSFSAFEGKSGGWIVGREKSLKEMCIAGIAGFDAFPPGKNMLLMLSEQCFPDVKAMLSWCKSYAFAVQEQCFPDVRAMLSRRKSYDFRMQKLSVGYQRGCN